MKGIRMRRSIMLIFMVVVLVANATNAYSQDFCGLNVIDRETSSRLMRFGYAGNRPTIVNVTKGSYASRYGFNENDVIYSINDKEVRKSSELSQFTNDILYVTVFRGVERITLSVDKRLFEIEKANQIEAQRKAAIANQRTYAVDRQDNTPAVRIDDNTLERMYGRSTPEQRERERQRALQDRQMFNQSQQNIVNGRNRRLDAEEAERQSKSTCYNVPGECGKGRVCVTRSMWGVQQGNGTCMDESQADRIIADERAEQAAARERQRDMDLDSKLRDATDKLDRIERKLR